MTPQAALERLLRPAGGGVYVVSTGLAEQETLQRRIYGDDIDTCWRAALGRIAEARVVLLAVPSDAGAGFTRGSNRAPAAIRAHLLGRREHPIHAGDVVDAGDVRVVPHFLSEDMLSERQTRASREVLYGAGIDLPVAPLDMCALALDHVFALNPDVVPVVLGGDHSVGWPAFGAAHRHWEQARGRRLGLLHFDAHTDLMSERLGVRYCFASWAYHANELLGRDGRLVQVGIRASRHGQLHWERTENVRQFWAPECASRAVEDVASDVVRHFESLGVDALYVSNDIDGTSDEYAAATGTPEPDGLTPDFVSDLVRALRDRFPLVGGDLVEVAPPLANDRPGEPGRTLDVAGRYLADLVRR